ncbi:hypothetical protein HU200_019071 [Digitaria exilis]|uniref:Wall-associated receptor kinase C-terminal domain-containing protein n=1 Tax=Digitaria exilis TaxID=1010633 RepID=A0A835KDN5_9POAL|nr:hypothetical protein HU200_019071 [Digitaria exilis]
MPLLFRLVIIMTTVSLAASAAAGETSYTGECLRSATCGDSVDVQYPFFLANATFGIDGYTAYSFCGVPPPQAVLPINCTGFPAERDGASSSYVAAQNDVPPWDPWPLTCKEVIVVPVLRELLLGPDDEYLRRLNSDGYGKLLKKGFRLTWDPSAGPFGMGF